MWKPKTIKNFIIIITRPTEIFGPHCSKGQKKYLTKFFNENIKDIRKTWICIKSLVSMKHKNSDTPSIIRNGEKYISDPITITNTFINCSGWIRLFSQKIKLPNKSFRIFLSTKNNAFFILTATNKLEICRTISFLNINKSCGPNIILTKILRLVQDQTTKHLALVCNLSLSIGIFPFILKITKVIPIDKKNSKLGVSNYRPISLLSNIDKIFEKLMDSTLIEFLQEKQILY